MPNGLEHQVSEIRDLLAEQIKLNGAFQKCQLSELDNIKKQVKEAAKNT